MSQLLSNLFSGKAVDFNSCVFPSFLTHTRTHTHPHPALQPKAPLPSQRQEGQLLAREGQGLAPGTSAGLARKTPTLPTPSTRPLPQPKAWASPIASRAAPPCGRLGRHTPAGLTSLGLRLPRPLSCPESRLDSWPWPERGWEGWIQSSRRVASSSPEGRKAAFLLRWLPSPPRGLFCSSCSACGGGGRGP